jgi:hypothetical protein
MDYFGIRPCNDEHDFKVLKANFKDKKALILKLKQTTDKGLVDVKSSIKQVEKSRQEERGGTRAAKKAKAAPKTDPLKTDKNVNILFAIETHEILAPIVVFATLADYKEKIQKDEFDINIGEAYIIENCDSLVEFANDRSVKTVIGVWKVQFPNRVKTLNMSTKATLSFQHDRQNRAHELLLQHAPDANFVLIPAEPKTALALMTRQVQMYAVLLEYIMIDKSLGQLNWNPLYD